MINALDVILERGLPGGKDPVFERINPYSGDIASQAPAMSIATAKEVVARAEAAFPSWAARGPNERRDILNRAAQNLLDRREALVAAMVAETGAALGWSHFNVEAAAQMLTEAAAMTTQITGEVIPSDVPGSLALSVRAPVGVLLGIAPWNAPMILCVRAMAMPLACGNTVVVKASEYCPALHTLIVAALMDAGLENGEVGLITHQAADAPALVEALVAEPAIRRINFTGSTRVGRIIAQQAAGHLKPVLLELGGKAPFIVLEDADLEAAVDAAIFGAFMNQGQICMSTERIIVLDSIADAFVQRFTARAAALTAGNPLDGHPLGACIDGSTIRRLEALIGDAVAKGARLYGGAVAGNVMQPAVVDGVLPGMEIWREESFGPAVSIRRVATEAEAIAAANDSDYGLSAALFTRDSSRALRLAPQIRSGICHINGPTVHDEPQMPFGGLGQSGYGRFGGKSGIAEFTETRWISLQSGPRFYPI